MDLSNEAPNSFIDVKDDDFYKKDISIAIANEYIKGVSQTHFNPEGLLDRQQACTIINRIGGFETMEFAHNWIYYYGDFSFADSSDIDYWARSSINVCYAKNIVKGMPGNRFEPKSKLTKAQAIVILENLANLIHPHNSKLVKISPNSEAETREFWYDANYSPEFFQGYETIFEDDGYIHTAAYQKALGDVASYKLIIRKYDNSFKQLSEKELSFSKEWNLGAVHHENNYNYIILGKNNNENNDNAVVIRCLRYDSDFNQSTVKEVQIKGAYTNLPFKAGSVCVEVSNDNRTVAVHTARQRYDNHQSNLLLLIDFENELLLNEDEVKSSQPSYHVSHSFFQFARFDGNNNLYLLDHGDAYPRSLVVQKVPQGIRKSTEAAYFHKMPGKIGANQTGVITGDFKLTGSSALVAINSIDFSKSTDFTHFEIEGVDTDRRDAFIYNIPLSILMTHPHGPRPYHNIVNVTPLRLTDYANDNLNSTYSAPFIYEINNGNYVVIWEAKNITTKKQRVEYVIIDQNVNIIEQKKAIDDYRFGYNRPIYSNGQIIWYRIEGNWKTFYRINI